MSSLTRSALRKVFAPSATLRVDKSRPRQRLRLLPGLAAAIIGVALTATAAFVVSRGEQRNAKLAFDVAAENRIRVLQAGLNEYLTKLGASQAMFNSVEDRITRREFESYANAMLRFSSSIQTLSWLPRVAAQERGAFELAASLEGLAQLPHSKSYARRRVHACPGPGRILPGAVLDSAEGVAALRPGHELPTPTTLEQMHQARDNARLGFYQLPNLASAAGQTAWLRLPVAGVPPGRAERHG